MPLRQTPSIQPLTTRSSHERIFAALKLAFSDSSSNPPSIRDTPALRGIDTVVGFTRKSLHMTLAVELDGTNS